MELQDRVIDLRNNKVSVKELSKEFLRDMTGSIGISPNNPTLKFIEDSLQMIIKEPEEKKLNYWNNFLVNIFFDEKFTLEDCYLLTKEIKDLTYHQFCIIKESVEYRISDGHHELSLGLKSHLPETTIKHKESLYTFMELYNIPKEDSLDLQDILLRGKL